MEPVNFPESNQVMKAPPDMKECTDLHVFKTEDGRCISCWKLSGEELMEILQTKEIWLHVYMGGAQPPVAIATECPFTRSEMP